MPAAIQWAEKYSVNIREIDNQHKKLIDMVNELSDAMAQGKGNDVLGNVLKKLADYTVSHFKYEEQLFSTHGYADAAAHKKEHDDLTAQVVDLIEQHKAGKMMLSVKTLTFLSNWLVKHIQGTDMKYKPFLNEKGVK